MIDDPRTVQVFYEKRFSRTTGRGKYALDYTTKVRHTDVYTLYVTSQLFVLDKATKIIYNLHLNKVKVAE